MNRPARTSTRILLALALSGATASATDLARAQVPIPTAPAEPPAAPPAAPDAAPAEPASPWLEPADPAPEAAPAADAPAAATPATPSGDDDDDRAVRVVDPAEGSSGGDVTTSDEDRLTKHPQWNLGVEAGVRVVAATDSSYDPYSSNDALASFALAASWIPIEIAPFSVGLIGEWNPGGSTGSARGNETSLSVHRASVGAQGRLALGRRVYLHARVSPALLIANADIHDPAIDRPLEAQGFTWGLDATGGAAVLIGRAGHPDHPAFRVWIVGEVGYAFTGKTELLHAPEELDDDPRQFGALAMAPLDTSGVVNRLAVAMTF